jgi:DNA processing protein
MHKDLQYQIALTLLSEVGDITAKKLVKHCGSVEAIFKEKGKNLSKIPGISYKAIHSILNQSVMKDAEKEIDFITKNDIEPIYFLDDKYPRRLRHCADGPLLLYFKGDVDFNNKQVLSVVGTREPSDYGIETCEKIIKQLAGTNTLIVSGLAYGIDVCSHRNAIKHGLPTVGVLGHGLDRIYPNQNKKYVNQMIENGGILTEFRKGTEPERQNFPQRNRIVAGMSDATLVVESKAKGGSLITAYLAFDYNRDVFAIPGRPTDVNSEGCNLLIKKNIAQLINDGNEIKELLNWKDEEIIQNSQRQLFVQLNENEEKIVKAMVSRREYSVDEISIESGLSVSKTATVLLSLEFKGIIKTLPGKQYKIV